MAKKRPSDILSIDAPRGEDKIKPGEPREDTPAPTAAPKTISKMDAVRKALAAGVTGPADIVAYALSNHNVVLEQATASIYKSKLKHSDGKAATNKPSGLVDALAAVREVKGLLERYSADEIRQILTTLE